MACDWPVAQRVGWGPKTGCGGGDEISYAVGFRFTEDFRTPLRAVPHPSRPSTE
jgi:hypothetical protein